MCYRAWELLQEKNRKDITVLATFKAVNTAIPDDGKEHDLAETAALILTLVPAR